MQQWTIIRVGCLIVNCLFDCGAPLCVEWTAASLPSSAGQGQWIVAWSLLGLADANDRMNNGLTSKGDLSSEWLGRARVWR